MNTENGKATNDDIEFVSNFKKLYDRQPTIEDKLILYKLREVLGLDADSNMWAILLPFQYYFSLYKEIPAEIKAANVEAGVSFKASVDTMVAGVENQYNVNKKLFDTDVATLRESLGTLKTDILKGSSAEIIEAARQQTTNHFVATVDAYMAEQLEIMRTEQLKTGRRGSIGWGGAIGIWAFGLISGVGSTAAYCLDPHHHTIGNFVLGTFAAFTLAVVGFVLYYKRQGVV